MLRQRNILYFKPFYFKNGNTAKNKYFVILSSQNDKIVLATLPTSKNHVPSFANKSEDCIDLPDANFNCFVISPERVVTECGKNMPRTTYIYGEELLTYSTETLKEQYQLVGSDYDIFGRMRVELFNSIVKCLKNSKTVKNKYKKLLHTV